MKDWNWGLLAGLAFCMTFWVVCFAAAWWALS